MRNTCLCLLLLTLGNAVALSAQGAFSKIEKTLHADIQAGRTRDVLLIFAEKTDLSPARYVRGKAAKAQFVVDALQKTARRSHANALALIRQHNGAANSLFMVNAIALRAATPALLEALAGLPELRSIAADPWVFVEHPVEETQGQAVAERSTIEWGVDRINAPALWAQGYSGQGISVGGADTGYDWEHPALSGHYRGTGTDGSIDHNYHWHDAIKAPSPLNSDSLNKCGFDVKHPCDDGLHGTHTMGTMIGDDGLGNQIGVAPGAKWIGCRNMERGWGQPSTYIECFQWFLAPTDLDGLNPDVARAPHVINNSWYCADIEGCNSLEVNELMRDAIIALQASGVVVVVSNGNFGPGCGSTNVPPAYFEQSFSIGATRMDDTIASFSSRGPVYIDGSLRVKPDVSAPGANIRSCRPDSNYTSLSGTSMAGPHVAGLVALILSAVPEAAGEVALIEQAIRETAIPHADTSNCGIAGTNVPNMAYGYGRVDALGASQRLRNLINAVSVDETVQAEVSLRPNPIVDEAIFTVKNAFGQSQLLLYDASGRQLRSKEWTALGQDAVRLDVGNLEPGLYFWEMRVGEQRISGKMMK